MIYLCWIKINANFKQKCNEKTNRHTIIPGVIINFM